MPLRLWSIRSFSKYYNINLAEAEFPIETYESINHLFTRRLKAGMRPVEGEWVHPADSKISQFSKIQDGQLIQAKGKIYRVEAMLKDKEASTKYSGGFFVTYYLCPTDYHRVHFPVSGRVTKVKYLPGALWPVNEWSVTRIDELFCINERVVIEIETEKLGLVSLVMVGATNVGKMSLSFEPRVLTNQGSVKLLEFDYIKENKMILVKAGDECGVFHMGSTVVMVYGAAATKQVPESRWQQVESVLPQSVQMGRKFI